MERDGYIFYPSNSSEDPGSGVWKNVKEGKAIVQTGKVFDSVSRFIACTLIEDACEAIGFDAEESWSAALACFDDQIDGDNFSNTI